MAAAKQHSPTIAQQPKKRPALIAPGQSPASCAARSRNRYATSRAIARQTSPAHDPAPHLPPQRAARVADARDPSAPTTRNPAASAAAASDANASCVEKRSKQREDNSLPSCWPNPRCPRETEHSQMPPSKYHQPQRDPNPPRHSTAATARAIRQLLSLLPQHAARNRQDAREGRARRGFAVATRAAGEEDRPPTHRKYRTQAWAMRSVQAEVEGVR